MVDQYPNPPGKTPDINTQWPWVKDKWGDTRPEVIMTNGDSGPNYEKIAALRPDLIIAVYSEIDQAAYDRLSKIAPPPSGVPRPRRSRSARPGRTTRCTSPRRSARPRRAPRWSPTSTPN
ncbi:ABC transporter substrate-binding protein [Nonomuraea salmonea]|uniref:ABC transporter substrate-binding protein n=1 Tax=Nonomuraea salmonea TaxID=46181 RepID=UPI0031E98313